MSIMSAFVLYAIIWFMTYFIAIPIKLKTQGDVGEVVEGTHAGAPEHHHLKKKAWITTIVATLLWAAISGIILSGWISVDDMDWTKSLPPVH